MKAFTTAWGLVALASTAFGALQEITNFGNNPTNIQMFVSVPAKVAQNPAIIVGMHGCGGSAKIWYDSTNLPAISEQLGFILVYPQTTRYNKCWDVNNAGSLTHGGTGDATGIISMVNYALQTYKGDRSKVFVMGGSSGAMMTNVMVGSYPEVFEAGASYSGVPFACLAGSKGDPTPLGSNQTCAQGLTHTPQQWAQFVQNAYPGYNGKRPRFLVAHGLADALVVPQCGYEQLKQWSTVLGVTNTQNQTGNQVDAGSQYTKMIYGDGNKLVGYIGGGVGHIAPVVDDVLLRFFGLMS